MARQGFLWLKAFVRAQNSACWRWFNMTSSSEECCYYTKACINYSYLSCQNQQSCDERITRRNEVDSIIYWIDLMIGPKYIVNNGHRFVTLVTNRVAVTWHQSGASQGQHVWSEWLRRLCFSVQKMLMGKMKCGIIEVVKAYGTFEWHCTEL